MGARREAREALAAAGLRPRKGWGQHFLCDPAVAHRIVETADVGPQSVVLEIGPGLGALTDELAGRAGRLYLVEVDPVLAARLAARYAENPRVRTVAGDVLAVDLETFVTEPAVTAVGNLPYNIAIPILFRLREARARLPRAVVMIQREVAERLVAAPGTKPYGALTVLTALYGEARIALRVSPGAFVPRPKVDSAVVSIAVATAPRAGVADANRFREIVRRAFGQRRKTLRAALAAVATAADIERAGIDPRRRGETLSLDEFATLANVLGERSR